MSLFVTTTGTAVVIPELGITITNPTTDRNLAAQFSPEEIREATSLTTAITSGTLIWRRVAGGANQPAADYDPDYVLSTALATGTGAVGDRPVTQAQATSTYYPLSNPSNYQTLAQVNAAIAALVASSPATLDTLNELAAALGNDPNFATTVTTSLAGKANLAGGNTFTGNQNLGGTFANITPAPLNMVNSAAGALRTQLNLVNTGGGGGAGSAIDFFTYDIAGGTEPGGRFAAIDDNFSAYLAFFTKIPGAAGNAVLERMRITNEGRVGIGGTPVASAGLQVDSTTRGFLPPRMTSAQRLAITAPAIGLQVYDTDILARCIYSGTHWAFEYDLVTAAIQTSTSTTYANITELVTASLEPGLYAIRLRGTMQSTATGTGVGLRIAAGTATISSVSINWVFSQAGAGTDKNFEYSQTALADNVTSASVLTANADFPVAGDGMLRISAAGTVAVQIRTEIAGNGVSIRPNSSIIFKKVSA